MPVLAITITTIIYLLCRYFFSVNNISRRGLNFSYILTFFSSLIYWYLPKIANIDPGYTRTVSFLFYLAISYFILYLLDSLLIKYYFITRRKIYIAPQLRNTIFWILYLLIVLLVVRKIWHLNPTTVLAIPTVLTAGVALAFQDTLKTFIAGIFLNKVIHIGDWISFGNYQGEVVAMDWVRTTIRNRDGDHIFILNSVLAAGDIYNFSLHNRNHRCSVKVGVAYHHPPHQIKNALRESIRNVSGILLEPAAEVYLEQYSDFTINYGLYFWINDYSRYQKIMDEVSSRIWYIFKRQNIEIPFPIRTIIQQTKRPTAIDTTDEKPAYFNIIEQIPLFQPLTPPEMEAVARLSHIQTFSPGEIILQQGQAGSNFYLILSGKVGIYFNSDGQNNLIKTLGPQQFFGEISLLTGEPCTATVIAREITSLVVLPRKIFDQIITIKPDIVEHLATELAHRSEELQIIAEQIKQQKDIEKPTPETLVKKIKKFFRLNQ